MVSEIIIIKIEIRHCQFIMDFNIYNYWHIEDHQIVFLILNHHHFVISTSFTMTLVDVIATRM